MVSNKLRCNRFRPGSSLEATYLIVANKYTAKFKIHDLVARSRCRYSDKLKFSAQEIGMLFNRSMVLGSTHFHVWCVGAIDGKPMTAGQGARAVSAARMHIARTLQCCTH